MPERKQAHISGFLLILLLMNLATGALWLTPSNPFTQTLPGTPAGAEHLPLTGELPPSRFITTQGVIVEGESMVSISDQYLNSSYLVTNGATLILNNVTLNGTLTVMDHGIVYINGSVINLKSNTEMMVRAALLLLNIIFGHKLAAAVATIKWPPLREGAV